MARSEREWFRFERSARAELTGPRSMPLSFMLRLKSRLRLSVLPSFQAPATYHLVQRPKSKHADLDETTNSPLSEAWWVTRLTWDIEADRSAFERGHTDRPTFVSEIARLDSAIGQRWVDSIVGKSCPLIEDKFIGLDGVTFELEWFQSYSGVKVRWWGDGPAEWRDLTSVAAGICEALEATSWSPIPSVNVEAWWEMSVPCEHELLALRTLIPNLAEVPMAELWKLTNKRPFPLGTMPLEEALALEAKAWDLRLRLNVELP